MVDHDRRPDRLRGVSDIAVFSGQAHPELAQEICALLETPLHPEYPCAHCINSGAVAAVLESEFGNGPTPGLSMTSSALPGVVRKWSSIREWADEMAIARIYGGVHYPNSIAVGKAMGKNIGELAVRSYLRPVH